MSKQNLYDLSIILNEMYDDTFQYDWENPYIDDINKLKKHYGKVDIKSDRLDSSNDYYDMADNNDVEQNNASKTEAADNIIIDKILDSILNISSQIVNWERNHVINEDEYLDDESFQELEFLVNSLQRIDQMRLKLSQAGYEKYQDTLLDLVNNNDAYNDEIDSEVGNAMMDIFGCENFIKHYGDVYTPKYTSRTITDIVDVCHEVEDSKKAFREFDNEQSQSQWKATSVDQSPIIQLKGAAFDLGIPIPDNLDKKAVKILHRKIVSKIHPDKFKDENAKKQAHTKFVNYINNVWDKLPTALKESSDIFEMLYQKIILS